MSCRDNNLEEKEKIRGYNGLSKCGGYENDFTTTAVLIAITTATLTIIFS